MAKQYAEAQTYEAKLEKVMVRLGVEKYNYDWSRFSCWVEFWSKGQLYRFEHSVENAQNHGQDIKYGSDVFAQLVLTLEDIARMTERGIYELQTWIVGLKVLPPKQDIPECFTALQFGAIPRTEKEITDRYRQLSKSCHPDSGGSSEMFQRITAARDEALQYIQEDLK
ncbi:MAG: J domain-containing protein [Oscillospiraceae bacterium]|nr:J domain-containing protein [Oscillospiraceae bacterium]